MPQVTCRCGENLPVPPESPDHLDCIRCGARIRLRRPKPRANIGIGDGFIRFLCPCGRRLKVSADVRPKAGKCPDCGRIVPVPTSTYGTLKHSASKNETEARTEDLDANDLAELEKWSAGHAMVSDRVDAESAKTSLAPFIRGADYNDERSPAPIVIPQASMVKFETGLRICPRCKKPLHLSADNCRACGMPVPRQ